MDASYKWVNTNQPPAEKGSIVEGKNLRPRGVNSVFLEQTLSQKGGKNHIKDITSIFA